MSIILSYDPNCVHFCQWTAIYRNIQTYHRIVYLCMKEKVLNIMNYM